MGLLLCLLQPAPATQSALALPCQTREKRRNTERVPGFTYARKLCHSTGTQKWVLLKRGGPTPSRPQVPWLPKLPWRFSLLPARSGALCMQFAIQYSGIFPGRPGKPGRAGAQQQRRIWAKSPKSHCHPRAPSKPVSKASRLALLHNRSGQSGGRVVPKAGSRCVPGAAAHCWTGSSASTEHGVLRAHRNVHLVIVAPHW